MLVNTACPTRRLPFVSPGTIGESNWPSKTAVMESWKRSYPALSTRFSGRTMHERAELAAPASACRSFNKLSTPLGPSCWWRVASDTAAALQSFFPRRQANSFIVHSVSHSPDSYSRLAGRVRDRVPDQFFHHPGNVAF